MSAQLSREILYEDFVNNTLFVEIERLSREIRELDETKLTCIVVNTESFTSNVERIRILRDMKVKQLESLVCAL